MCGCSRRGSSMWTVPHAASCGTPERQLIGFPTGFAHGRSAL